MYIYIRIIIITIIMIIKKKLFFINNFYHLPIKLICINVYEILFQSSYRACRRVHSECKPTARRYRYQFFFFFFFSTRSTRDWGLTEANRMDGFAQRVQTGIRPESAVGG